MLEVPIEESRRFMEECLQVAGIEEKEAKAHAELLLQADLTGHFSHGLNRLELYLNDIRRGATDPGAKPIILKETVATAWVDGRNGIGATVGTFCMDLAIKKAKGVGIACVSVKRCNHFGMAGWWAQKAQREGMIGLAFTNSSPIMVPTRAKEGIMGTNPIGMAAPATGGDSILVDMASTVVALGKIEVKVHKNEQLPSGWVIDADGNSITDAKKAYESPLLLPLGGFEETSGYKGYGLGAMIEIFCSGLSGSRPSHRIPKWSLNDSEEAPDLGQFFVAIDPGCFAPGFGERVADCLQTWRNTEPADPSLPVLAPGDKERSIAEETKKRGTILYAKNQIDICMAIAKQLKVKPLEIVNL